MLYLAHLGKSRIDVKDRKAKILGKGYSSGGRANKTTIHLAAGPIRPPGCQISKD